MWRELAAKHKVQSPEDLNSLLNVKLIRRSASSTNEIENGTDKGVCGGITEQKAVEHRRSVVHYQNMEYWTKRE